MTNKSVEQEALHLLGKKEFIKAPCNNNAFPNYINFSNPWSGSSFTGAFARCQSRGEYIFHFTQNFLTGSLN